MPKDIEFFFIKYQSVAKWLMHQSFEHEVEGSNPKSGWFQCGKLVDFKLVNSLRMVSVCLHVHVPACYLALKG